MKSHHWHAGGSMFIQCCISEIRAICGSKPTRIESDAFASLLSFPFAASFFP
mgnify:CR=1 FL=1